MSELTDGAMYNNNTWKNECKYAYPKIDSSELSVEHSDFFLIEVQLIYNVVLVSGV